MVYSGGLNAGPFELVVKAVVISPGTHEPADAKIRNRIVPPGGTLVADADTLMDGLAGADGDGDGVGDVREGAGLGLAGDDDGEGAGEEPCLWPPADAEEEAAGLPVPLGVGVDGTADAEGAAEVDGAAAGPEAWTLGTPLGDRVAEADAEADDVAEADGDGLADADDATAMTMVVTPLKIRKKPVARISVTGRTRVDRMGDAPPIDAVMAEIVLHGVFVAFGALDCARSRFLD